MGGIRVAWLHGLRSCVPADDLEHKLTSIALEPNLLPFFRIVDECDITSPSLEEHICTSESHLAAVLNDALKQGSGAKLWVNISQPTASSRSQPALTLEAAMRLLQHHYSLPAFSVLDALSATHRCKLDRDGKSIYCSLLAFSYDANMPVEDRGAAGKKLASRERSPSSSADRLDEPLLVSTVDDDAGETGSNRMHQYKMLFLPVFRHGEY